MRTNHISMGWFNRSSAAVFYPLMVLAALAYGQVFKWAVEQSPSAGSYAGAEWGGALLFALLVTLVRRVSQEDL